MLSLFLKTDQTDRMRKLLTVLELKPQILEKAEYREWMPHRAPQQPNGCSPQRGFIIELNTAKDRDRLVPASPKLKNMVAETVIG